MSKTDTDIVLKCPQHGRLGAVGASIRTATAWCKQCKKWYGTDGKSVKG